MDTSQQLIHHPKLSHNDDEANEQERRQLIKQRFKQQKADKAFQESLDATTTKTQNLTITDAAPTPSAQEQLEQLFVKSDEDYKDPHQGLHYSVKVAESGCFRKRCIPVAIRSKTPDVHLQQARLELESQLGVKLPIE
jgi:hypothetical protein